MRVSREQSVENRVKILQVAARLFREKGFDGVGIAELMKKAGLTHGGFYGHFSSKDELMAESCERAVDELLISHQARTEDDDRFTPYQRFIAHYLSCEHRDNPGSGCLMAALGAEAARQSPLVKRAFTQGANRLLNAAMKIMPAKKSEAEKREDAMLTLATLVGAQVIARALDDPELSEEVLRVVQKKLH